MVRRPPFRARFPGSLLRPHAKSIATSIGFPALVRSLVGQFGSNSWGSAASFTSTSFKPANGVLLVALIGVDKDGSDSSNVGDVSANFTLTDTAGLTWTQRQKVSSADSAGGEAYIYTAQVTTGASMTITLAHGGVNVIGGYYCRIYAYTGHDTASPAGAKGGKLSTTGTSDSFSLSAAPAVTSDVLCVACSGNPQDWTVGASFVFEYSDPATAFYGVQSRSNSVSTTVDLKWAATAASVEGFVAVEIKRATVSVSPAPALLVNAQTLFGPTLRLTLKPVLHSDGDTFYAPTVSVAGVNKSPPLLGNAQSFFAPRLVTTLKLAVLVNSQTLFSPKLSIKISPAKYSNAPAFYSPAAFAVGSVAPLLYVNASVFHGPAIVTTSTTRPEVMWPIFRRRRRDEDDGRKEESSAPTLPPTRSRKKWARGDLREALAEVEGLLTDDEEAVLLLLTAH